MTGSSEQSLARQADRRSLHSEAPYIEQQQSGSKHQSLYGQTSVISSQRQPSRIDKKPEKSERIYPSEKKRSDKLTASGSNVKSATQHSLDPVSPPEYGYYDTHYEQKQSGYKKEISASGQFKHFFEGEESEYAATLTLYDTNQKSAAGKENKNYEQHLTPPSTQAGKNRLKQIEDMMNEFDQPEEKMGQGRLSANYQSLDQPNKGSMEMSNYDKPRQSGNDSNYLGVAQDGSTQGREYIPLQDDVRPQNPASMNYTVLDEARPQSPMPGAKKGLKPESTEYQKTKDDVYYYDYYDVYYGDSNYYTKTGTCTFMFRSFSCAEQSSVVCPTSNANTMHAHDIL